MIQVVDPSAFTPPYDHALCSALARAGASVELVTSRFAYGAVPEPDGYEVRELFYRHARGGAGSRTRRLFKLAEHVPDMLRLRRGAGEVVHFQWLDVQWLDGSLLPRRPTVLTAHDLLPREPRPGQVRAQRRLYERVDAVVVHSDYGRRQLEAIGIPATVIHHGAFEHLTRVRGSLPPELPATDAPVVLFFGLLRPYKGLDTLLEAWRGIEGAELWIVGRPMISLDTSSVPRVRLVPRFVDDGEAAALFARADIVVLPYTRTERLDFSGVLATGLAFGKAMVASEIGGFGEVGAAQLVAPGDAAALHEALAALLGDPDARARLSEAARAAAAGPYSWDEAARKTLALYNALTQ
jgi:glycosyltransferase involved in cell wall biosynthesis